MCSKNCTSWQIENRIKIIGLNFLSALILSVLIQNSLFAVTNQNLKKGHQSPTPKSAQTKQAKNDEVKGEDVKKLQKGKKRKYTDSFFAVSNDTKEKSEKELNLVLSGLNALIPIEKSAEKKSDLLLSKAVTLLSLGKIYYLNNKLPSAKEKKINYLNKAMKFANEATIISNVKDSVKARALHVYGMSALYMDNEAKSVEYFEQAIKLDPLSKVTPRLSVFIAEHYFETEKFEQALPYYGQFFNRLTPEEKSLALYKSAWCFLALKQFENAEKSFLKIVGKTWAGDFGVDAIRDLAQTVTAYKSETEIIQFGVQNMTNNSSTLLSDFYTNCYLIFLRQSGNTERNILYDEILRLEKRPEKRVSLAIKKLSAHQKGYASSTVYKDILEIEGLISQSSLKPETDLFRTFGMDLEVELKKGISAYVDTIAKKLKTPEAMNEIEIATKLQKLLWFHVSWFPTSSSIPQTYILAMDNCAFLKDADCSLRIGRLILRQESLKNVWHRARVEIIIALETLSKRDLKYQGEFVNELKTFADTEQKSKEWIPFTKKLTSIFMNEKKFSESEPYLTKIYESEKNPENLYRKLYCQYNQNKFKEVVSHLNLMPKDGSFHVEIKSLIRESSLSLAKEFADHKNFNEYEKYLFQFLNLGPDESKADIVKSDYLNKLIEMKAFEKVISFYNKVPPEKKFSGSLQKPMELLVVNLFSLNRFPEVRAVLSNGSTLGQYRSFDYYWFRLILSENEFLNEKEIKVLSSANPSVRLGILSLAAVTNPKIAKDYFRVMAPLDDKERKIWLLSQQMLEGQKVVSFNSTELNLLGKVVNSDILPVSQLKSEKLSKLIEFPQPTWSQERLAKVTPDAMDRVKSIRKQIIKDLKDQRIDIQKRIVVNGINVERKMAWFFDESPIPDGLTAAELTDYKKQIDSFSQDYYLQIDEYEKLLSLITSKENEINANQLMVPKNISKWKRSVTNSLSIVESEINKKHFFRSLIVLESLKDLGEVKEDENYRWRSYAILSQFPHEFASNYLQDELSAYKQVAVLSDWSKLVGVSIRSTASEGED